MDVLEEIINKIDTNEEVTKNDYSVLRERIIAQVDSVIDNPYLKQTDKKQLERAYTLPVEQGSLNLANMLDFLKVRYLVGNPNEIIFKFNSEPGILKLGNRWVQSFRNGSLWISNPLNDGAIENWGHPVYDDNIPTEVQNLVYEGGIGQLTGNNTASMYRRTKEGVFVQLDLFRTPDESNHTTEFKADYLNQEQYNRRIDSILY